MASINTLSRPQHPYITSQSNCSPVIAGTRFPVRSVVEYVLKQGLTPEELVREFKHLSLVQIYDALSYYYDYRDEIEQDIQDNDEEKLRDQIPIQ